MFKHYYYYMAKLLSSKIGLSAPITLTFLVLAALLFYPANARPRVAFHQDYIEGHYPETQSLSVDLDDVDHVFDLVFSALRDEVKVYPTENYYYFVFKDRGRPVWGNIHLPPADEIGEYLDFAYWEFENNPKIEPGVGAYYKQFSAAEGVSIKRMAPLDFSIEYKGKKVLFSLNDISQQPPVSFPLGKGEVISAHTFDESGYRFFLVYDTTAKHFLFALDEDGVQPEDLEAYGESVWIGKKTGFAFYQNGDRKILMAVNADNVKRNNYFDGPFDQLGDNFVSGNTFSRYLQEAYPYAKGRIDKYGRFIDADHSRLAVTPYRFYRNLNELPAIINECIGKELSECITYDSKEASNP